MLALASWLGTGLGIGRVVVAPGTVGAAMFGMPLAWAVGRLPGVGWQLASIAALVAVGVPLCTAAGRALGGKKDNQAIIWDEIVTVPMVFVLVPLQSWSVAVAGFLLHRIMDITKPPPARWVESLPEGLGVMADDVVAAVYAGAALFVLAWLDHTVGLGLLARRTGGPLAGG